MGETLRVALLVAAKDLRAELKSRTALIAAVSFAAMVLMIFIFARDSTRMSPVDLLPSALWITYAFAATTALHRAFALEKENGALDLLRLAPIAPEAIFFGKFFANLAVVLVVAAVTWPLAVLFFNADVSGVVLPLVGVTFLATPGFVAVGTIIGAVSVRTRFAELMLPLLLLPFLLPPLVGGVQVTARLLAGRPLSEVAGWLRLLAVHDVVFVTVCALLFRSVVEE